jgi:hypothetical protein
MIFAICTVVALVLLLSLAGRASAQERAPLASPIIINHTCTDLSKVPAQWIKEAKKQFRIGYGHTSHGSQIVTGINAFRGNPGSLYYFTVSSGGLQPGIFLNDNWAGGDLGCCSDLTWKNETVAMLNQSDNDRNVIMWSWCGGVSGNTRSDIKTYLDAMNRLEKKYPNVRFIYMTGHLDGSGATGNLNIRNNQIRSYCLNNNKVLFDFADIESFAPTGRVNYMKKLANDNCDYDSNGDGSQDKNWAADWVAGHPDSPLTNLAARICDGCCAHSQSLNCLLKGRAFWWMMARLAGWPGPAPALPNN